MKNIFIIEVVVSLILTLTSCNEKQNKGKVNVKYSVIGKFILKEVFYDNKKLKSKSTLTLDSIQIHEQIEYFSNGEIKKWLWYDKLNDYPVFGLYFDSIGKYKKIGGTPFIRAPKIPDGSIAIELVNPPNIKSLLVYRDFFKNKLQRQIIYEPGKTDSTEWVTLDEYKYDSTHKYFLTYIMLDKLNNKIDSVKTELEP